MAFDKLDADLDVVQKLDDEPNDEGGLTADELKAKFDESGNLVKTYINDTLLPALEAEAARLTTVQEAYARLKETGGAAVVGAAPFGTLSGITVQRQLLELLDLHEALQYQGGAAYIGTAPFNGVPGATVQAQLRDVQKNVEDINSGIIPTQSVTMEKLGLDVLEHLEAPPTPHFSSELDDYRAEIGVLENAGAGWNAFRFREPFEAAPVVTALPLEFSGWVEVKQVTEEGFLYCLRRSKLTPGTVETASVFVGAGAGSSTTHSAREIVTAVAPPTLGAETVRETVKIGYIAMEYGGER